MSHHHVTLDEVNASQYASYRNNETNSDWAYYYDDNGYPYWYNHTTGESQWATAETYNEHGEYPIDVEVPVATPIQENVSGEDGDLTSVRSSNVSRNSGSELSGYSSAHSDLESDCDFDSISSCSSDENISSRLKKKKALKQLSPNWKHNDPATELEFQAYLKTKAGREMLKKERKEASKKENDGKYSANVLGGMAKSAIGVITSLVNKRNKYLQKHEPEHISFDVENDEEKERSISDSDCSYLSDGGDEFIDNDEHRVNCHRHITQEDADRELALKFQSSLALSRWSQDRMTSDNDELIAERASANPNVDSSALNKSTISVSDTQSSNGLNIQLNSPREPTSQQYKRLPLPSAPPAPQLLRTTNCGGSIAHSNQLPLPPPSHRPAHVEYRCRKNSVQTSIAQQQQNHRQCEPSVRRIQPGLQPQVMPISNANVTFKTPKLYSSPVHSAVTLSQHAPTNGQIDTARTQSAFPS